MQGQVQVEAMLEALRRPASPYARLEMLPSGGAREPDDEPPSRHADPHFGKQSVTVADDETELERVAPSASTLTRSVPKRRSMRRGVDG
jgi:hypothetical protein